MWNSFGGDPVLVICRISTLAVSSLKMWVCVKIGYSTSPPPKKNTTTRLSFWRLFTFIPTRNPLVNKHSPRKINNTKSHRFGFPLPQKEIIVLPPKTATLKPTHTRPKADGLPLPSNQKKKNQPKKTKNISSAHTPPPHPLPPPPAPPPPALTAALAQFLASSAAAFVAAVGRTGPSRLECGKPRLSLLVWRRFFRAVFPLFLCGLRRFGWLQVRVFAFLLVV